MRRWLIALATALVAGALCASAAYADDHIYHGNYNAGGNGATTNRCAGCHRAHTATGPELLKASTTFALCTTCHGAASGLDVVDGVEWQTNSSHKVIPASAPVGGTKGGGFVQSFMNTTMKNPPIAPSTGWTTPNSLTSPTVVLQASTSAHQVNGMPGYTTGTAWGYGAINSGAGMSNVALECTSCHDPHGGAGGTTTSTDPTTGVVTITRVPTYRILRANTAAQIGGTGTGVVVPEDASATHEFVVDSAAPLDKTSGTPPYPVATPVPTDSGTYYGQTYQLTGLTETQSMQTISNWCATCHTRIHTSDATSNPATNSSGDPIFTYRHDTTGGSVENNLGTAQLRPTGTPGCLTCHTAHGSSAASTGQAATVLKPGVTAVAPGQIQPATDYLDSSLLRLDSRGVCEVCHNK